MLCGAEVVQGKTFKGRQFTAEVILWSVRWYLMFPISYHRRIKRLISPGLGFGGFRTARRTLAGFEAMAMIRKGQVRYIGGNDIRAQSSVIAGLFQIAA
jgi:transposase-like protein